jgi:hypothetical protein
MATLVARPAFRASLLAAGALLIFMWWKADARRRAKDELKAQKKAKLKAQKKAKRQERQQTKANHQRLGAEKRLAQLECKMAQALSPGSSSSPLRLACVDIEAWERGSTRILEIGLAFFVTEPGGGSFRHRHLLIEENLALRNGCYVADNRDSFLFGDSEVLPLAEAVAEVSRELGAADYIVGHALAGDLAWLRSIGVKGCIDRDPNAGLVDTQFLAHACSTRAAAAAAAVVPAAAAAAASAGGSVDADVTANLQSLKDLCNLYSLDPAKLHNGANDAAFTLQVMLSQCGMPFDPPARTPSTHTEQAAFVARQAEADAAITPATLTEGAEALLVELTAFARQITEQGAAPALQKQFTQALTSQQRKFVHEEAPALGLRSFSQGRGAKRRITVCAAEADAEGSAKTPAPAPGVPAGGR